LNAHYQLAGDLIGKHAMSRQLRTLDAIQLAVALHFHRSFPLDHFVCADSGSATSPAWRAFRSSSLRNENKME
jgi:hypothetical protein